MTQMSMIKLGESEIKMVFSLEEKIKVLVEVLKQ